MFSASPTSLCRFFAHLLHVLRYTRVKWLGASSRPRAALHHRIIEVKDVRFSYLYTSTSVLNPSAAWCRGRFAGRLIPVG
jgi:hypothetical protein